MILIGQYDSPFVRRVGIALTLRGVAFEHRPWSVFGDSEALRAFSPLTRVPTLVLDTGESILDSHAIIDFLEGSAPAGSELLPREEPARRRALRTISLALGMAELAVSLFYELRLHEQASPVLTERRRRQIVDVADVLESDRSSCAALYGRGDRIGHEDIALACSFAFVREAHPNLLDVSRLPSLASFSERAEALPVFLQVRQPFRPPT